MAEIRLFQCKPYGVSLTPQSCALRHRKAHQPNTKGIPALLAAHCVGCTVGKAHAEGAQPRGVRYATKTTSLPVVTPVHELPPESSPPPTYDERRRRNNQLAEAKRRSKRPPPEQPMPQHEPMASLVDRVRAVLDRRPYATAPELQQELAATQDPQWRLPSHSKIRSAVHAITGGADRRLLSLGRRKVR